MLKGWNSLALLAGLVVLYVGLKALIVQEDGQASVEGGIFMTILGLAMLILLVFNARKASRRI